MTRLLKEEILKAEPYLYVNKEYLASAVATGMPSRMRSDSSEDQRERIMRENPHQKIPFAKITDPRDRGWRDNTAAPMDEELLRKEEEKKQLRSDDITIVYPTEEREHEEAEKLREALWSRFFAPKIEEKSAINGKKKHPRGARDDAIGSEKDNPKARYPGIPKRLPKVKGWSSLAFKPLRDVDNQRFFPQANFDKMPFGEAGKVRDDKMRRSGGVTETERYNEKEDDDEKKKFEIVKQRNSYQWYQYSTADNRKRILERAGINEPVKDYDELSDDSRAKLSRLFDEEHVEGRTYKEDGAVRQNQQYGDAEGMLGRVGFNVKPKKDTDAKEKLSPLPREAVKGCPCKEEHDEKLECPLCKSEVHSDIENGVFVCIACNYGLIKHQDKEELEIVVG